MQCFFQEYNLKLTKQQEEIVSDLQNNLLVYGSEGSGKSTLFLAKTAYLIQKEKVNPMRVLLLTSNNKAKLLQEYQYLYCKDEDEIPTITTIHQIGYRILKRWNQISNEPIFQPYKNLDKIIHTIGKEVFKTVLSNDELQQLKNYISYYKAMMLTNKEMDDVVIGNISFLQFMKSYEKYKEKQCVMDYDDILQKALEIMMNYEDIRLYYQQLYPYILMDQGEELSFAGHMLLKTLVSQENKLSIFTNKNTLNQYIGAYPQGFQCFQEVYIPAKIYELKESYTISKQRATLVNKNFSHLGTIQFQAIHDMEDSIVCKAFSQADKMYQYTMKQVMEKETCILSYYDPIYALPLLDLCIKNQISYHFCDSLQSFFQDIVIKEIVGYFTLIIDPYDKLEFVRNYKALMLDLSEKVVKEVVQLMKEDDTLDVFQALMHSSLKAASKKVLLSKVEMIRMLANKPSALGIRVIIEKLGYDKRLKQLNVSDVHPHIMILKILAQQNENVKEFIQTIKQLKVRFQSPAKYDQDSYNIRTSNIQFIQISNLQDEIYEHVFVLESVKSKFYSQVFSSKLPIFSKQNAFIKVLTHGKHIEFLVFKNAYDTVCEVFPFIYQLYQQLKSDQGIEDSKGVKRKNSITQLKKGIKISHITLGEGIVVAMKDGMLEIEFDNKEKKSLNAKLCLQKELIQIID